MHLYKSTNNKPIHIFQLQKFITIYLVYICCKFFYICLLQVENLDLTTNLENYYVYGMLIACKCTSFYITLDYDAKSEPPYLATTHLCTTTSFKRFIIHIKVLFFIPHSLLCGCKIL
jgi:hypothetical protein